MRVLVAIPVLDRPARVEPLLASLRASGGRIRLRPLFVCSPGDTAELEAVRKAGATALVTKWDGGPGDWAKKINLAYETSREPWIFTAADDLRFERGWADEAIRVAGATGAQVIGTNDLGNPRVVRGRHATHNLVSRRYADEFGTIDGNGAVVTEVYDHNFVDDELVETAVARGAWAFAEQSVVEHLHPHWGKGNRDRVYDAGEKSFAADRMLFSRRRARLRAA